MGNDLERHCKFWCNCKRFNKIPLSQRPWRHKLYRVFLSLFYRFLFRFSTDFHILHVWMHVYIKTKLFRDSYCSLLFARAICFQIPWSQLSQCTIAWGVSFQNTANYMQGEWIFTIFTYTSLDIYRENGFYHFLMTFFYLHLSRYMQGEWIWTFWKWETVPHQILCRRFIIMTFKFQEIYSNSMYN